MIRIHFCRSNSIGSYAIQGMLFSKWSHVAIEIDGLVYDATLAHGVACWSPENFRGEHDEIETDELHIPDEAAAVDFLRDQLGKRYDWAALLALPFRETWQDDDRWFCSELVAMALKRGGILSLSSLIPGHRVTPRDVRVVSGLIRSYQVAR